jgi:hypothetical protein
LKSAAECSPWSSAEKLASFASDSPFLHSRSLCREGNLRESSPNRFLEASGNL